MSDPFLGEIHMFVFDPGKIKSNYALCNGALLHVSQNSSLYSLLGNAFGGVHGQTFALPDLRGRAPLGAEKTVFDNTTPGCIGYASGTESVVLQPDDMPPHTHPAMAHNVAGNSFVYKTNVYAQAPANINIYNPLTTPVNLSSDTIGSAGESLAHNNMQPFFALAFCIAIRGTYPPRP